MLRKVLWTLAVAVGLAAAGAYLAFNYVDLIVKGVLEHWGPDVTGTTVTVEGVHISPADGRGVIRGFELGSPPGFSAKRALRFGEVRLAIDPATLTSPVIVIREILVDAPQITFEREKRRVNLDAIQERIEAYVKQSGPDSQGKADGAASRLKRRFIIERLDIRGGRVLMTNAALKGQGVSFDLPDVELRDLGKRQGGITASQAAAVVASVLQVRIAQKILTNVDALRKGGVEGAVDALKGLLR